jgi:hypothetical protein
MLDIKASKMKNQPQGLVADFDITEVVTVCALGTSASVDVPR